MKLTRAMMAVGLAMMLGCAALVTGPAPASAVATLNLNDGINPSIAERDRIGHNARIYIEDNVSWRRAASAFADICTGVARA